MSRVALELSSKFPELEIYQGGSEHAAEQQAAKHKCNPEA